MDCVNHEVNKLNVTVRLCGMEEKFIINNIYPLYLHDLSEVWEHQINRYGVFENDDTRTLIEQNRVFDIWWEHPNVLFPYLSQWMIYLRVLLLWRLPLSHHVLTISIIT
ncbi:hypothetical protein [Paenibacillus sp. N3/727]|uniref:hypothetical protein n=1 Tax=Paenibacillus sp. N3/727 TaxID=2925845 RepID=UPI0032209711